MEVNCTLRIQCFIVQAPVEKANVFCLAEIFLASLLLITLHKNTWEGQNALAYLTRASITK
jgi:hypothetical protein